jgi:predicted aldo/keto reductase-like oxidoreductase
MSFDKIKKNFGFGCMRLKMNGDAVDYEEFNSMIDAFMDAGFNYFDTAHGYIGGKSETAIRDCLAARYPREDYVLANKISHWFFEREEDVLPLFESQLKACGVEYFDFYLFHTLTREIYEKHKKCKTFEAVQRLKEEGKIKHIAMSFHDNADVLDMILTEQPCIEAVQLQFNYLDYDDPGVQSRACYDVAVKHGKKVMVMEPVKGGALVNLPDKAKAVFDTLGKGSYASYALRFSASFPEVFMTLSGMGSMDMMRDNLNTFSPFVPLSSEEFRACEQVRKIIREVRQIPCTACSYCTEVCPQNIPIPNIFKPYNEYLSAKITLETAKDSLPKDRLPGDCIKCGACEKICPQNIAIREHLEEISKKLK